MFKFWRSTCDVQIRASSGLPEMAGFSTPRRREVPPFIAQILSIAFDELGEIDCATESCLNRRRVGVKPVRGELEPARGRTVELDHELVGVFGGPAPQAPGQGDLCIALEADEGIGVTDLRVRDAGLDLRLLLHLDEGPNLISLEVFYLDLVHQAIEQRFGLRAGHAQEAHDRVAVRASDSLSEADRGSLDQEAQAERSLADVEAHPAERPGRDHGEGRLADLATVARMAGAVLAPSNRPAAVSSCPRRAPRTNCLPNASAACADI
jgi:hypothetical protein